MNQGLEVAASSDQLSVLRDYTRSQIEHQVADHKIAFALVLGVDEACQNIIRHAFGGAQGIILSRITHDLDFITFDLFDNGPLDPTGALKPTKPLATSAADMSAGGLGLHFIEKIFYHWSFTKLDQGLHTHHLRLIFDKRTRA